MDSGYEPRGYLKKVLGEDERIHFAVRQHPLFFLRHISWSIIFTVTVFFLVLWLQIGVTPGNPAMSLGFLLLIVPLAIIWWAYLVWKNHAFIVTARRVIQINGVLNKEVVDSLLEKINDVKTDQSLIGQWFDYGDVEILTANEVGNNVFKHISSPLQFKRAMMEAKEALGLMHQGAPD
ncbi:MAG: PH domain-containing protein [Caulobacteraceae bacterium]|nr:PH domain-containing protein [Caulobacteraceae bacterium]